MGAGLQDLAALTGLLDLRLRPSALDDPPLTASDLAPFTRLTSLHIRASCEGPEVEAAVLAGKPHLQNLYLDTLCFIRLSNDGRRVKDGFAAMLSEMQHLQELTCLCLYGVRYDRHLYRYDVLYSSCRRPQAFAALTASSKLQRLSLDDSSFRKGFWGQMFNPSRPLPQLQQLSVKGVQGVDDKCTRSYDGVRAIDLALTATSVARLARCCQALQRFEATDALMGSRGVAALSALTALEVLHLTVHPGSWANALAQLQALKQLQVWPVRKLAYLEKDVYQPSPDGMLQLTQLQRLSSLHVGGDIDQDFKYEVSCSPALQANTVRQPCLHLWFGGRRSGFARLHATGCAVPCPAGSSLHCCQMSL